LLPGQVDARTERLLKEEIFIAPKCQASRGVKKAKMKSFNPIVMKKHSF
jgi:hypothetical protein